MKQSYMPWQILLAGALTTQVACADGADSIQILRNQVPDEGCVIPVGSSDEFQPRGRIDVTASSGYLFTPLVQSLVEEVESASRLVFVEGANVDISFVGNPPDAGVISSLNANNLLQFRQPFSGSIEPGGQSSFAFDVVPRQVLDALEDHVTSDNPVQLSVDIVIVGSLGGSGVDSNTFKYPVEVCSGCLTNVLGACDAIPEGVEVRTGGVCNTLQDGVLDCCSNADGSLTCPAVPIVPPPV